MRDGWAVAGSLAGAWGPENLALALSEGRALAEFSAEEG